MTRILVVDNYDSFVFTIVGYLEQLEADCEVVRNDAVAPADGGAHDHAEGLVAEAYPEHRLRALAAGLDHRHAHAGLLGRPRAG